MDSRCRRSMPSFSLGEGRSRIWAQRARVEWQQRTGGQHVVARTRLSSSVQACALDIQNKKPCSGINVLRREVAKDAETLMLGVFVPFTAAGKRHDLSLG